jgi:hypothetical protein
MFAFMRLPFGDMLGRFFAASQDKFDGRNIDIMNDTVLEKITAERIDINQRIKTTGSDLIDI